MHPWIQLVRLKSTSANQLTSELLFFVQLSLLTAPLHRLNMVYLGLPGRLPPVSVMKDLPHLMHMCVAASAFAAFAAHDCLASPVLHHIAMIWAQAAHSNAMLMKNPIINPTQIPRRQSAQRGLAAWLG